MRGAQMEAMPRHDPVPPRRDPRDLERSARAWLRYRKLMRWMALLAIAAVLLALLWLQQTGETLSVHMIIATAAGVGLSVLVGTGLMGLVFVSSRGGHDDAAAQGSERP